MVPLAAEIRRCREVAFAGVSPDGRSRRTCFHHVCVALDTDRLARAAVQRTAALSADLVRRNSRPLRAQLQPDFLFDALNAVTVLARRENASAAAEATEALADLLRYTLKAGAEGA